MLEFEAAHSEHDYFSELTPIIVLILMNFAGDLDLIAAKKLTDLGYKPNANDTAYDRFIKLYTFTERTIPQQRYVVKLSKEISKNPKHEKFKSVVDEISQCLSTGGNVSPYLSKKAPGLEFNDDLLNHWGIHHLHLNSISTKGVDGFVSRKHPSELLFLRIKNDIAYFIDIRSHADKNWENTELIEIVDRNWPDLHYSGNLVTGNKLSEEQIRNLRKNNCNTMLEVNGRAIFPTLGVFANGAPAEAGKQWNLLGQKLSIVEKTIRQQFFNCFYPPRSQWFADVRLYAIENNDYFTFDLITKKKVIIRANPEHTEFSRVE